MTVFSRWWTPFGVIGGGGHSDDFVADIPPPAELLTLPGVVWGIDLLLDLIGEDICGVGPAKGGVLQRQTPPFAALFFSLTFLTRSPPEWARAPPQGSGFGPRHLLISSEHDNPRTAWHGKRFWRHKPPFCRRIFSPTV